MPKNAIDVQLDTREFQAALRQAAEMTSRSTEQVVNGQSLSLAFRSLKATKRAQKAVIAAQLGQVATKVTKSRKTGKLKAGARVYGGEGTYAARIINRIRIDRGQEPLFGQDMEKAVKKFINSRIRSIGFIASGWIWSIKDIGRKVKPNDRRGSPGGGGTVAGVKAKGQRKGRGIAARKGLNPTAQIVSQTIKSSAAQRIGMAGLQSGMRETVIDMRRHAEKKLQKAFNKVNAR